MADRVVTVTIDDRAITASVGADGAVHVEGDARFTVEASQVSGELVVKGDGGQRRIFAVVDRDKTWVCDGGVVFECTVEAGAGARRRTVHHHGSLTAPMPATVIAVHVRAGDTVARGQTVILLEAMKMELPLKAPGDGTVVAVHCQPGELVQPNVSLIDLA